MRDEQSRVKLQVEQRGFGRGYQHEEHLREGAAPMRSSWDRRRRTAGFEQFSNRNSTQLKCSAQQAHQWHLGEQTKYEQRPRECRDSGACKKDSENVRVLEGRVALLEKHSACLERELKAVHTKPSTVNIAPEKAQQGPSHGCRVCPQTFESSTQLHRHLRNSKHFSPPPSPASRSEDVSVSGSSATKCSISTPPNVASPLARTTPTAAMEHASFPP
jgi:hypothetical protein